jgi:hypothetical protein
MAFTFGDALEKYGIQLRQGDVGEAYRRAGVAFKGQMQQKFVVLHDSRPPIVAPWIRKPAGEGAKQSWLVRALVLERQKKERSTKETDLKVDTERFFLVMLVEVVMLWIYVKNIILCQYSTDE